MSTLPRRSFLSGLAALPLAGSSGAAADGTNPPDPIFAAIERHKAALQAAEQKAAEDAWSVLYDELVDMPASTIAGLQIKVRACDGDPELSQEMMASIAADILAMEGGVA